MSWCLYHCTKRRDSSGPQASSCAFKTLQVEIGRGEWRGESRGCAKKAFGVGSRNYICAIGAQAGQDGSAESFRAFSLLHLLKLVESFNVPLSRVTFSYGRGIKLPPEAQVIRQ